MWGGWTHCSPLLDDLLAMGGFGMGRERVGCNWGRFWELELYFKGLVYIAAGGGDPWSISRSSCYLFFSLLLPCMSV